MADLLIATNNAGKLSELRNILGELPINLFTLSDLEIVEDIAETGNTFEENAAIKATCFARLAKMPTLADDSGLAIDCLDGRPGIFSARYAGENASDEDRIRKVLSEMKAAQTRTARFVSVTALSDADGNIIASVEGICEGTIIDEPRGASGFGYDPIFLPDGFAKTFAELDAETKNQISHRGIALSKILPFLRGFFDI